MPALLERLYDKHAQSLFAFLLGLTRNETDTRDLLQEVFCKLASRPWLLDGVRDERSFLLRLARNAAIDLMRRSQAREKKFDAFSGEAPRLFEESADPDEQNFQRALEEALGALPPEQREVAHLKLWEGATFERIAGILGISPNTAASRYRYAIDKLRGLLRPLYEEIKTR